MSNNIDDIYPRKYLEIEQFSEGDWELTIAEAWVEDSEDFNKQPCKRVVLSFEEVEQQFPLSPTNAGRIKALYGPDWETYPGKTLLLGKEDEPKSPKKFAIRIKRPLNVVKPPTRKPLPAGKPLPPSQAHARTQPQSEQEAADAGADNINF